MCLTLGGGTGLVCIGLVARGFGIPAAWLLSAALLVLTAPGFVILEGWAQGGAGVALRPPQAAAQPQGTDADLVL
jgi:hypothetical protein